MLVFTYMGEIVIKIPNRKNRSYVFTDSVRAEELIDALDKSAIRVKNHPLSPEELEDALDIAAANAALREIARTGKTYSLEEIKAEFGI
ncbi:MAG: hypothetical protein AB7F88_12560 [Pyrinomonadaceae bacterium]